MRVAVVGGTGRVGEPLVAALRSAGHAAVVVARSTGADAAAGRGLEGALAGVDAVVDVTDAPPRALRSAREAERFFAATSTNLQRAGARAGVRHHVVLSAVGVDRVAGPPAWAGKRAQEAVAQAGPVPTTVVRATAPHDLGAQVVATTREGTTARVPPLLLQPVAVADLAVELARVVVGPVRGRARDVAGPRTEDLVDMARRTAAARSEPVEVLASWRGTPYGVDLAGEVLLPSPDAVVAPTSFDSWLLDTWLAA